MHEIEVWVLIDSAGDYAAGVNEDDVIELYDEKYRDAKANSRLIKITLKVPPIVPVELTATIPATSTPITMEIA